MVGCERGRGGGHGGEGQWLQRKRGGVNGGGDEREREGGRDEGREREGGDRGGDGIPDLTNPKKLGPRWYIRDV